jgi:hypothetical protein
MRHEKRFSFFLCIQFGIPLLNLLQMRKPQHRLAPRRRLRPPLLRTDISSRRPSAACRPAPADASGALAPRQANRQDAIIPSGHPDQEPSCRLTS